MKIIFVAPTMPKLLVEIAACAHVRQHGLDTVTTSSRVAEFSRVDSDMSLAWSGTVSLTTTSLSTMSTEFSGR